MYCLKVFIINSRFVLGPSNILFEGVHYESRFVLGPSNILFGGVILCTFQPGHFTGWGSEGVNQWVYTCRLYLPQSFSSLLSEQSTTPLQRK